MTARTQLTPGYDNSTSSCSQAKSIFESRTVWSIIFTVFAAITPIVGKDFDRSRNKQPVNYGQDIAQIVVILCGAAASVCGRVDATGSIYTPDGFPGPNKSDFEPKPPN